MPEPPTWLVMRGDLGEAKKTLLLVSNTEEDAAFHLRNIMVACKESVVNYVPKELILVRQILIAAIGLHFFVHATGVEACALYSVLNKDRRMTKGQLFVSCTVGLLPFELIITKIICTIVSTFLLDKISRRQTLLTSIVGIFTFCEAIFSLETGPITTWVYSTDIFPMKAQGLSYGVVVNRVMNVIVLNF